MEMTSLDRRNSSQIGNSKKNHRSTNSNTDWTNKTSANSSNNSNNNNSNNRSSNNNHNMNKECMSGSSLVMSINTIIVLICTGIMLFQCGQCFNRFFGYPTKAILSVLPTGEATFPALTICPKSDESYKKKTLQSLGITKEDFIGGNFYGNSSLSNKGVDAFNMFKRVTYNLSEMMYTVKISTADAKNALITINFSLPLDPTVATFKEVYDIDYGRCYSMMITPMVTKTGIINVVFSSKMGIYVYIHHPGQFMDVSSMTKVYGIYGNMSFVDITHELTINTLEGSNKDNPCNSTVDFTFDDCLSEGITDVLNKEFGCVVPFVPKRDNLTVCKFDLSTESGEAFRKRVMDRYDQLSWSHQREICPQSCSTIDIFLGLPFGGVINGSAYIKLYVKSTVKKKQTVWDYTWVSMMAEVGGYTGLFLGIAVVNITDSLDWILFKFFNH